MTAHERYAHQGRRDPIRTDAQGVTGQEVQQARNLAWKLQDGALRAKFLLRDRDSKFTAAFDEVFKSEGVEIIRLPYRRPVANAFAERWVGSARREVLDRMLIFGRRHLEKVLAEYIDHYNHLCRKPLQVSSIGDFGGG